MKKEKELKISAIEYGTVIDHIPANATFKVASILELNKHESIVSVATNLPSKHLGKKGIIKVADKLLSEEEVDKIGIIAPDATLNIIKNYNVEKKIKVEIPDTIEKIIKCSNPVCITNKERVKTRFLVVKKNPIKVKCSYCERVMSQDEIEIR